MPEEGVADVGRPAAWVDAQVEQDTTAHSLEVHRVRPLVEPVTAVLVGAGAAARLGAVDQRDPGGDASALLRRSRGGDEPRESGSDDDYVCASLWDVRVALHAHTTNVDSRL